MATVTLTRSDLYSFSQAGDLLGIDRRKVAATAAALDLTIKSDYSRPGKLLDRLDVQRIADKCGKSVDWAAAS